MPRLNLFQVRRGTAAEWAADNPVLKAGEQGYETDTRKSKHGDGVTPWNALFYDSGTGGGVGAYRELSDNTTVDLPSVNAPLALALSLKADRSTFSSVSPGLAPASGGGTSTFLRADGTFATPSGGGDMLLTGVQTVTGTKTFASGKLIATAPSLTAPVGIVRGDVGLGNADNTSDASKPVSIAQQNAINLKANLASPTFTGTVGGITKAMVGLPAVDNTADVDKPVSSQQQTAINLKINTSSIVNDLVTGGATVPASAETVKTLQNTKAVALPQSTLSAGTTAITHALHANRPLIVNQVGATFGTFAVAATSGAVAGDSFYLRNTGAGVFSASGAITAAAGFKLSAAQNEVFTADYDSIDDAWYSTTLDLSSLAGDITVSATAPSSPRNGQGWFDLVSGRELRWINDGSSSQWVET